MSNVIKRSLQTTIFTTVLSTALIGSANSYTINNDVIDLSPLTPWSVSKAGNGAQAYCTLSKTFKKDIILTLADSNNDNLTFALDFQKNRFVPQSNYNIILATDNGDSRSYEINPATEKAFIVHIKDDPDFQKNLWSSHSLMVSVNTENYRFNTADFLVGKVDISSCLARLETDKSIEPVQQKVSDIKAEIKHVPFTTKTKIESQNAATLPETTPAEALSLAPEVKNANFKTERLQNISKIAGEVEVLKEENRNLKKALKEERAMYESKLAEANLASNDTAVQELSQKISMLSSENKNLKNKIRKEAEKASLNSSNMAQKLTAEVDRLKTENKLLQTSLEAKKNAAAEEKQKAISPEKYAAAQKKNAVLMTQIKTLETENAQLNKIISETKQQDGVDRDLISSLTSKNTELQKKNNAQVLQISKLDGALKQAQAKIQNYETMKQQIVALKTENAEMVKSFAALETASGQATPSGAEQELEALQKRYAEQELQLQRMAQDMEQQRQDFKLEQQRLETMLFDPAVTEQKQLAHLAKLERELALANQALSEQRAMYEGGQPVPQLPHASQMTNSERVTLMEMSKEIQRLRDEIDRLRRAPKKPTIAKAAITQKKVVLSKGQTIETAPPIEEKKVDIIAENPKPIEKVEVEVKKPEPEAVEAPEKPMMPAAEEEVIVEAPQMEKPEPAVQEEIAEINVIDPEEYQDMKKISMTDIEEELEPIEIAEDMSHLNETEPSSNSVTPKIIRVTTPEADPMELDAQEPDEAMLDLQEPEPEPENEPQETVQLNYKAANNILALPDPEMETLLKKQDRDLEIKNRQNGMVFWSSEGIEGTIIRKHLQGEEFDLAVKGMISNLEQKCPSILDVEPVLLRKGKTGNLFAYDANCGASSIGLVFYSKDGQTVSTVSYGAQQEDKATLDVKREKLIEALMGNMSS